jgi:hypothetical protein
MVILSYMGLFSFFRSSPPSLRGFTLQSYSIHFSLDRLVRGVDNLRYDVRLSPEFIKSSNKLIRHLLAKHGNANEVMALEKSANLEWERKTFKRHYTELSLKAINRSKLKREIQIDYLAQTAIVKLLLREIRIQYDFMVDCFIRAIRKNDLKPHRDLSAILKLKEDLSKVRQSRNTIIRNTGVEIFQYLSDIQDQHLTEIREINFGVESLMPKELFINPMLHVGDPHDDKFMMEEYGIMMGRRFDDPDRHDRLIGNLKTAILNLIETGPTFQNGKNERAPEKIEKLVDQWLKSESNIDLLINYFKTETQIKKRKNQQAAFGGRYNPSELIKRQKQLLNHFFAAFNQEKIIPKIMAALEIQSIYRDYCPPLTPRLIAQYLYNPKSRKQITRTLNYSKSFYHKTFSFHPLRKKVDKFNHIGKVKREKYFINFLKSLVKYHRDLENLKTLKEVLDFINIAEDEKTIILSKTNNTLFEFYLPQESVAQEKPVINHVIIKADVRGSTFITRQLKRKKLNPASYFSLNFFDPITEILPEYGSTKVFIEGDAVILAIEEYQDTPEGWYSVARACGLAMNVLAIVRQYNIQCRRNGLPALEIGIGISFVDFPPTYLFDENNRIMISPAINLADRLSSCSKLVKSRFPLNKKFFNIYLFKTVTDAHRQIKSDERFLRYNVNGIELSTDAFKKLGNEIELKYLEAPLPEIQTEKLKLFVGKYPTVSGATNYLVIRRGEVYELRPGDLEQIVKTGLHYYEVVTNQNIVDRIKRMF